MKFVSNKVRHGVTFSVVENDSCRGREDRLEPAEAGEQKASEGRVAIVNA